MFWMFIKTLYKGQQQKFKKKNLVHPVKAACPHPAISTRCPAASSNVSFLEIDMKLTVEPLVLPPSLRLATFFKLSFSLTSPMSNANVDLSKSGWINGVPFLYCSVPSSARESRSPAMTSTVLAGRLEGISEGKNNLYEKYCAWKRMDERLHQTQRS
jgi:hypothetical protein